MFNIKKDRVFIQLKRKLYVFLKGHRVAGFGPASRVPPRGAHMELWLPDSRGVLYREPDQQSSALRERGERSAAVTASQPGTDAR